MNISKFIFIVIILQGQLQCVKFGSSVGVPYLFNYTENEGWCNSSFECEIISYMCWKLARGQQCTLEIFNSLEQRITSLEKNEVDIVVSRFSVSPKRSDRIEFVRPYYYSSGAVLYSLPKDKHLFKSYDDLVSQPICMDIGYYAAQIFNDEYGLFIFPSTKESVLELIKRGYCIGTITDSIFTINGLVQTKLKPLFEAPYGVAISKNPIIENLKQKIQDVLLEMFVKKDKNLSYIENWEKKFLLSQGIFKNLKLQKLVEKISTNGGGYIGTENEDEIWQSANLISTKKFSEQLVVIDPEYDKICRGAMKEIYDSIQRENDLFNLPVEFFDSIAYTFTLSILNPKNMIPSFTFLQHPILQTNLTALQISKNNPQFLTAVQNLQDIYLQDKENQKQGAFFYVSLPYDGAQVIDEKNRTQVSLSSPTRVIKTLIYQVLQQKDENNRKVIMSACGVGELRNW